MPGTEAVSEKDIVRDCHFAERGAVHSAAAVVRLALELRDVDRLDEDAPGPGKQP